MKLLKFVKLFPYDARGLNTHMPTYGLISSEKFGNDYYKWPHALRANYVAYVAGLEIPSSKLTFNIIPVLHHFLRDI